MTTSSITNASPPAEKIALFRSLFRGREDVYPQRFESRKTGRAGYSPACGNEWVRGVCEKPRIKCSDCPRQEWLPLSEEVVRWHLSGANDHGNPFVLGVYPMLRDERCWFLAVDFDGEQWSDDAVAYLATCVRLGISAVLERSRSGNGGHVWIFFAEPLPAVVARKLGALVLTETMDHRPEVGLKSYDRFFPNQDTLPSGGFGNLIALPLQKAPREDGNSVFVDSELKAYPDQWAFLASVQRMAKQRVEDIVRAAESRGRIVGVRLALLEDDDDAEPWNAPPSRKRDSLPGGPMPTSVELVCGDQIYIPKASLPPALRNALVRIAAFQNPEFYKAQAMRLPTYDKPRIIACAEDHAQHIALPRGCMDEVLALFQELKINVQIRDERFAGRPLPVSFCGALRPDQQTAGAAMLAHDTGVLSATTAFGKTVLAAWLIAQRGVNTLVVVHRQQLMEQWVERLSQFLGIPAKEIGRWGGGRKKLTGNLDIALMQSLVRKDAVNDLVADYGHLVVDECHHLSAQSFELVARRAKAKYVTGLSATVARKDGHHPIILMQCGPVRHKVDARQQAAERPFTHEVLVRPTGFVPPGEPDGDKRVEFQRLCDAVMNSVSRNEMIAAEVIAAVSAGRSPVVLTERTEHLEILSAALRPHIRHVITLQGGMGRKPLTAALEQLRVIPQNEPRVIVATGRFLGEGFDDSRLDTLFLTMPVSWRGTIAQYVGRLHRLHDGKRVVQVYDYADLDVPMLLRMFDRRCAGYEAVGYKLLFPNNTDDTGMPGDLFTEDVRKTAAALLFERLESLPETAGKLRINTKLPIAFDGLSETEMEIDLLYAEHRIAIEIDGPQHLTPDHYRRDRRKDALLQANGYIILRFLAEDLGKHLDAVLDAIYRAIAARKR